MVFIIKQKTVFEFFSWPVGWEMGIRDVVQMCKKDVSTKGEGRGIGLCNVEEILNRYDNVYHETRMEEGLFIQQVQIF